MQDLKYDDLEEIVKQHGGQKYNAFEIHHSKLNGKKRSTDRKLWSLTIYPISKNLV